MKKIIEFFLTPDSPSSRRVRKFLAVNAPGLNRIAGSWAELMAQAHAAYLLPPNTSSWTEKLNQCLTQLPDDFWAGSFQVAPLETVAELDAALNHLVEGAGPDADWSLVLKRLPQPSRLHKRLDQLFNLLETVGTLPELFQLMDDLLKTKNSPLYALRVYHLPDFPGLSAWQSAVLDRLAVDAPPPDNELHNHFINALEPVKTSQTTLLTVRALYQSADEPTQPDNSLHVLATRDRLEEVEVAAGIIQKSLSRGNEACSFGILLPNDVFTAQTVETVFKRCGIPISGLERSVRQRDLGREVVRLMLLCLRKPAPIMSIAALLTSPLMPWSMKDGQDYAQAVMDGDVLLKKSRIDANTRLLMDMVDEGADTSLILQSRIKTFRRVLKIGDSLFEHRQRALECVDLVLTALQSMTELEWETLLSKTRPESITTIEEKFYWKEGVAIFHEGREPWGSVRHLLVLGFNDGHFPAGGRASAVLTEAEWESVSESGCPVVTIENARERQRAIFTRQIASASDSLTILFSRRDIAGKRLEPSSSLVFLARRFGHEPENLVLELDRSDDLKKITELAIAMEGEPIPPRKLPITDIELKDDLLAVFGPAQGGLAPLSPSAAETLMVSPFAWLLGRLGCEPREWLTDALDPMTAGTLAHRVFEELFPANRPLIDLEVIREQGPMLLRQFTLQLAPFLRSPDWRVERLKLESEIVQAALRWRDLLASWDAELIAAEQWLRGKHNDILLRGQSDLLLRLPSGILLVVDYKKSSSTKRRKRMRSRFDLQAHLYRLMIQSGGLPAFETTPVDIGVVYYLLNDLTALSDSAIVSDGTTPGLEIIDADISSQAMEHLNKRLDEIRAGRVLLNTEEDENWWEKNASIPIYALDNSPLLRLFMHTGEETS